jgi:phage-related protein
MPGESLASVVAEITFKVNQAAAAKEIEQAVDKAKPVAKPTVDKEKTATQVTEAVAGAKPVVKPEIDKAGTAEKVTTAVGEAHPVAKVGVDKPAITEEVDTAANASHATAQVGVNEPMITEEVDAAVAAAHPVAKVGVDKPAAATSVEEAVEHAPPATVPIDTAGTGKEVEKGLKSADTKAAGKESAEKYTGAFTAPVTALKGMVMGAVGASAIIGGQQLFSTMITQAGAASKATKVVTEAIKTTGGSAGITADQIDKMAGAQARSTGIDKTAIQQSDALLLRYTGIKNAAGANNDVFNQTSKAALDMTAALNKGNVTEAGLTTTTKLLGKALEDPSKAAGVLRKSGVDLTDQQQAQIKTMMAANDTLGAQKVVLEAVNASYGGTAAATASGTAKMKAALSELEASVGKTLLPIFAALIKAVTELLGIFAPLADWFARGGTAATILKDVLFALVGAVTLFLTTVKAVHLAMDAYAASVKVVESATKAWKVAQEGLDIALDANVIGIVVVAVAALAAGIYELYKHSQLFRALVADIGHVLEAAFVVPLRAISGWLHNVREDIDSFTASWEATSSELSIFRALWDYLVFHLGSTGKAIFAPFIAAAHALRDIVKVEFDFIAAYVKGALDLIIGIVKIFADLLQGHWGQAWKDLTALVKQELNIITGLLKALKAPLEGLFSPLIGPAKAVFAAVSAIVKAALALWTGEIKVAMALITGIFKASAAIITGIWKAEWAIMEAVVKTWVAVITAVLKVLFDVLAGIFHVGMDVIHGNWSKAWSDLKNTVSAVTGQITGVIRQAGEIWGSAISQAGRAMSSAWSSAWGAMRGAATTAANAIGGVISKMGAVIGGVPRALEAAANGVAAAMAKMKAAVADSADFISSKLGVIGKAGAGLAGIVGHIPGLAMGGDVFAAALAGYAGGGIIHFGTGPTADDVLIRASRGETVVSAKDSRNPVMLAAFHAVGVPGYANGGLLEMIPGFAGGGALDMGVEAVRTVMKWTKSQVDKAASEVLSLTTQALHLSSEGLATADDSHTQVDAGFKNLTKVLSTTAKAASDTLGKYGAALSYARGGVVGGPAGYAAGGSISDIGSAFGSFSQWSTTAVEKGAADLHAAVTATINQALDSLKQADSVLNKVEVAQLYPSGNTSGAYRVTAVGDLAGILRVGTEAAYDQIKSSRGGYAAGGIVDIGSAFGGLSGLNVAALQQGADITKAAVTGALDTAQSALLHASDVLNTIEVQHLYPGGNTSGPYKITAAGDLAGILRVGADAAYDEIKSSRGGYAAGGRVTGGIPLGGLTARATARTGRYGYDGTRSAALSIPGYQAGGLLGGLPNLSDLSDLSVSVGGQTYSLAGLAAQMQAQGSQNVAMTQQLQRIGQLLQANPQAIADAIAQALNGVARLATAGAAYVTR